MNKIFHDHLYKLLDRVKTYKLCHTEVTVLFSSLAKVVDKLEKDETELTKGSFSVLETVKIRTNPQTVERLLIKINRLHVAECLFGYRSQNTSICGRAINVQ